MEGILAKLLVADKKTVDEGTKELKEAFKQPGAIPALCDIIVTSTNPHIRQLAAVLLRKKLGKRHQWNKLDADTRNRIKQGILQALVHEQEKLVKNAIAQFIGIVGKHEFPNNTWPEILEFVHNLCNSANTLDKELGMYTLSIMTEISKSTYLEHAQSFAILFTNTLNSITEPNSNLAYYTVLTMNNLVPVIGGHQQMINVYHNLLPRVLEIINAYSESDEKRACELFEIVEELVEYAVVVVVPHIKLIVEICLKIGRDKEKDTSVQIKAIGVVGWLIRSKGKVVQKNKLIEPIIDVLIQLMAQKPDDDVHEEYFMGDPDQFTPITIATQTLDLIALHIPAEKVIPYLLARVEPAIQGDDIYAQKAAYLALAVLAEGCAERIRKKYLRPFLECVCKAIQNPNPVVRNAAFFALGQFAEHLQPEISQYASELLPVLFEYLAHVYQQMETEKVEPASLDRMFYALETFCENLDDGLLPYLPTLMERLFVALNPNSWSLQLKRVALSALGSAASAVKEGMLPYFPKVLEILNLYITADSDSEIHQLQCYALESLAVVAQFIGAENFKPLANKTLQLGLNILNDTDDPDIRKSVFALFAALSIVMKDEISPALPKIIEEMIDSIQSSEGIVAHYEEEEKEGVDVYEDLSDSEEDLEDVDLASTSSAGSTQCRYSVENSYNEEKEQACLALREICLNAGQSFLPYIEKSFEEIFKLINYPQEDIRKASIEALQQFCVTLHKVATPESRQALLKALQMFVPKCAELIRLDEERGVVMTALEAYATLLEEIKGDVLIGEGHREAIMNSVIDVLTLKTTCQDTDLGASGDNNEDDDEAEQDELLLECAGDVIPKFANAITSDDFSLYFPNILQLLTVRTKKQHSISQRSFAYGTLAECMKPLNGYVKKFAPELLNMWLSGAKDSADEVRNNSIYGLGEMVLHGKEAVTEGYPQMLQALSSVVSKETHTGTLDNICGAIAKMIIANSAGVPLDQVFPVLLQHLPLKEDFQENEAVIKCFYILYQQGNEILRAHLPDVIRITVQVYHQKQSPSEEVLCLAAEFLKTVSNDFSEEFGKCISALGPEVTESVQKIFIS